MENPYSDDVDLNYVDQVKADVSEATLDNAGMCALDFNEVQRVLKLLENPYSDDVDLNYVDQVKADVSEATLDDAGMCSLEILVKFSGY